MVQKLKVLVVDDEENIVNVIRAYLEAEGHDVVTADNGIDALEQFYSQSPNFIILDLMMPELSGEEVCKIIRETSDVPIIMLTAKVSERDRISGLDLGADDYVVKPFSPGELMARVRAVERRQHPRSEDADANAIVYCDNVLVVDDTQKEAHIDGMAIGVTLKEFNLLKLLCAHPGRAYSREELVERVLGYDYEGFDRTIDVHIKNLRKKLKYTYIETVYGMGYRFKGDADHAENKN